MALFYPLFSPVANPLLGFLHSLHVKSFSRIYRAKHALSKVEGAALCHFDRREKSFSDPSHSLGMTDLVPSLGLLCVPSTSLRTCFARVILYPFRNSKTSKFQICLARPSFSEGRRDSAQLTRA
jgi:hypothetical protein